MPYHTDIEKLPLEIDGVPVREVVREVFRTPENGTPDNISSLGCLDLAKKGKAVWNCWRQNFPTNGSKNRAQFINVTDFSIKSIDFSGFEFGDQAIFAFCKWSQSTNLNATKFGNSCRFIQCKWDAATAFMAADFGQNTTFVDCNTVGPVRFDGAKFGTQTSFIACVFENAVIFDGTIFEQHVSFLACEWLNLLRFSRYDLQNKNHFFYDVDFSGCLFKGLAEFVGIVFAGTVKFDHLSASDCYHAQVEGESEKKYARHDCEFLLAPKFFNCQLSQATSLSNARFPAPTGTIDAVHAYRALKQGFNQQQAAREEQRFFKLEMEEEAMQATWFQKKPPFIGARPLYFAYKHLSDFGFSVARPLVLLVVLWLVFAQIYGGCWGLSGCEFQSTWLQYSATQALPLPGFDKLKALESIAPPIGWLALHKVLSLAALFLAGLALRNLFKLK